MDKIEDLRNGGQSPGAGVEQVERGNGVEVGEDGVYPDHPEHTGTHDDDDSGHHGLAQTAGSGNGAVHKGRNAVGQRHDPHTLHTGINNGAFGGEEGEELPPEQEQAAAQR